MILTEEQIAERRARLTAANQRPACGCIVTMTIRLDGLTVMAQCTKITHCDLHDPNDYLDTLEAAWLELRAWRDGGLTEEILRNQDGYIKVGRGCLLVSEHYLEEKDATIAALTCRLAEAQEKHDASRRSYG